MKPRRPALTKKVLRGLAAFNESIGEIEKPTQRRLIKRWREIEHARRWIEGIAKVRGVEPTPITTPSVQDGPLLFEGREAQNVQQAEE